MRGVGAAPRRSTGTVIYLGGSGAGLRHQKFFGGRVRRSVRPRLTNREARAIDQDAQESLTVDELRAAISAFSAADMLRLRRAACHFKVGTSFEWKELLNEAIVRALEGSRHCPRDVPPVHFLANAMRSIVSADRDSAALRPPTASLSATGTEGVVHNLPSPQLSVEELRISREECAIRVAALEALFEDDEEAQMVIMGDIEGLDADAIREMQGWDKTKLATVRRRIRRRIDARYPKGLV